MDKQKQIEEMAELMASWALQNNMLWHEGHAKALAETFVENDYGKIPEGAVVLEKPIYDYIMQGNRSIQEQTRKETAEKFAEMVSNAFSDVNCIDIDEWHWFRNKIDEIRKEITGGKNNA